MTPAVTVQLSSGQVDIAGLEVTGSLAVVSNGRLRVLGLATVQADGALVIGGQDLQGGGLFYTLVNQGSVEIRSWVNGGAVTNHGTIEFSGNDRAAPHNVVVTTGLDNQGTLVFSDPARPTNVHNLSNHGSVEVEAVRSTLPGSEQRNGDPRAAFFVMPEATLRDEAADALDNVDFTGGGAVNDDRCRRHRARPRSLRVWRPGPKPIVPAPSKRPWRQRRKPSPPNSDSAANATRPRSSAAAWSVTPEDLRAHTQQPHPVGHEPGKPLRLPCLDSSGHRRPLPERGREREGDCCQRPPVTGEAGRARRS
jgi:hypothetical protein